MKKIIVIYILLIAVTFLLAWYVGAFDLCITEWWQAAIAATITVGVKYGYFFVSAWIVSWYENVRRPMLVVM